MRNGVEEQRHGVEDKFLKKSSFSTLIKQIKEEKKKKNRCNR
jgi:hypothetical protein